MEVKKVKIGLSIASMVLGICGIVFLWSWVIGIVCGILAIIFYAVGHKKGGKGMAITGLVCGIIATVLSFFVLIESINEPNIKVKFSNEDLEMNSTKKSSDTKKEYIEGEVFENDDLTIKFNSANKNFTEYISWAELVEVKEGYKVIKVEFEFENIGNTHQYISISDFNCYADKYSCETLFDTDNSLFTTTLYPKMKAKIYVYFKVPIDSTEILLEYKLNNWCEDKLIFRVQ